MNSFEPEPVSPERFLEYLRDEEGLEAFFDEGMCHTCLPIVAFVHGLRHVWHQPGCEFAKHLSELEGDR